VTNKTPAVAPSIARVREALAEADLDAVVCLSPANVHYLSGTSFLSQRALRDRPAIVVVAPAAEPVFIVMKTEAAQAEAESWISDRRTYMQFVDSPFALLAQILGELGLDSARIGFEDLFLSTRHFLELRDVAPNVEWVPAETLLDRVRSRKTELEQGVLIHGSLATDRAIADAFGAARVGQSEREIGDHMVELARAQGGGFKHLVLATGKNWSVHHVPGETLVAPGDLLRVDFGMTWDYYASDLARTAVVAPATAYQLDTLRSLEEIQQILVQALKPGVRASDIYRLGANEFERRNLDFHLAHIGHGIGLSIENMFETPVLQPYDDTELAPGMIICLEPSISGRDGLYHMEDLVEITDGGAVIRARARDWSEPLVIAG
jgi:Xaa-Pro aminopeptidase